VQGAQMKNMADIMVVLAMWLTSPLLKFIARYRTSLPRAQRMMDRLGVQLRSTHYYEPTYGDADLPTETQRERPLPGLDLNEDAQLALLAQCRFQDELRAIPLDKTHLDRFGYRNPMYSFGDAEMLYNIIRLKQPQRIIEIGSGNSTLMARLAIEANARDNPEYECAHFCIEPYEMPWLEGVGVTVRRQRVEQVELEFFDTLGPDDILFIDSSHVIRPFGDVLREFHQIVPRVAPGVLIHVDDVFTPRDYPDHWLRRERRLWNEQYLLESFLAFNSSFEVVCASNWLKHNHPDAFLRACPMMVHDPAQEPGNFWFRRKVP
jgi:predicted O-methyltransferase YrrM